MAKIKFWQPRDVERLRRSMLFCVSTLEIAKKFLDREVHGRERIVNSDERERGGGFDPYDHFFLKMFLKNISLLKLILKMVSALRTCVINC